MIPQDVKDWHPSEEEDAFVILTRDQCVVLLCLVLFVAYVMKDYL